MMKGDCLILSQWENGNIKEYLVVKREGKKTIYFLSNNKETLEPISEACTSEDINDILKYVESQIDDCNNIIDKNPFAEQVVQVNNLLIKMYNRFKSDISCIVSIYHRKEA